MASDDNNTGAANDALRQAFEFFAAKLPARIEELRIAVDETQSARGDADRLEHAVLIAHRLRGTAGSFGHMRVSALAGDVEDLLVSRHRAALPLSAEDWTKINAAVEQMGTVE